MTERGDRLSDEQAQHVWRRAAELQATATDSSSRAPAAASGPAAAGPPTGYTSAQIREAAAEAGIAPEFVARALAEGDDGDSGFPDRIDRWARRLGGPVPRALVASRRFDRPIEEVHAAVQRACSSHGLVLVDASDEPPAGRTLVFALPARGAGPTTDVIVSDLVAGARVEEIRLRLLPLDGESCIVTVAAPLGAARRAHLRVGGLLAAAGGLVGGWAIGAIGAAVSLPLNLGGGATTATIAGAVLLGLGGGGRLGTVAARAALDSGQRRGAAALDRLLQAAGLELRGQAVAGGDALGRAGPTIDPESLGDG